MKKLLPVFIFISLTGCAARQQAAQPPPELIKPVSVAFDTAVVERGDVQVMDMYKAYTRVESEGLYFGETSLAFKEFFVIPGQAVKEGDLLAALNTEWIEEDIAEQQENIAKMKQENAFANGFSTIAIDTVRAEYVKLVRESGLDEDSIYRAENKRKEIAAAELALEQQIERQALTLQQEEQKLAELRELLPPAELRAPYDGEINLIKEKLAGDSIKPYEPVMYITDKRNAYIEIIPGSGGVSGKATAFGYYQGKEYALERVTLSRQDTLYYATLRVTAPVRYTIATGQDGPPPLGAFVTVKLISNAAADVLRVPFNAVYADPELGQYVYRVEDGVKVPVYIKTNLRNGCYTEVTEGLREGDEIYVKS